MAPPPPRLTLGFVFLEWLRPSGGVLLFERSANLTEIAMFNFDFGPLCPSHRIVDGLVESYGQYRDDLLEVEFVRGETALDIVYLHAKAGETGYARIPLRPERTPDGVDVMRRLWKATPPSVRRLVKV